MTKLRKYRITSPGFTVIELLIVIALISIMAAIVVPMATDTSDFQVKAAAETLVAALEHAQTEAIVRQEPVTVTFDLTAETYSLSNASGPLIHPIDKKTYVVGLGPSSDLPEVVIVSASFGGSNTVTFDVLGAPDAAGTVKLQAGVEVYTVDVMAATGLVSIGE
jgi:prepilin-type N-terminal cleavage/methylation domain-containing protein